MAKTDRVYDELNELWESFQENHRNFDHKGNKAAEKRARNASGEIKKLVTEYRQASVNETRY